MIIKGSIQQEDITLVNMYVPNKGAPKYIKQVLMEIKGEIKSNTVTGGNCNTPLTSMDRSSRQNISQGNSSLKWHSRSDGFNWHLQNISSQRRRIYIFFSSVHRTSLNIDHMLGHKMSLNKFKKIEIISSILSDHNGMKLAVNHRKKTENT